MQLHRSKHTTGKAWVQLADVKSAGMKPKGIAMAHIGDNIRRIRRDAGLGQQELAERCGISKSQISRLESGEQKNPQIQTVIAIATAMGVSLDEIVYGESAETMTYLSKALDELPEQDKASLKKLIRGWLLISHTEQLDKEE